MRIRQQQAGAICRRAHLAGASLAAILICTQAAQAEMAPAAATTEEVVVTGQRLSTQRALEQQKDADGVSNVISADDLGKLPDANMADALSRVPGISVVNNQETGEGEYVTVRSLAATFNAYSVNGVRVAETDGSSRQVSLSVLPPNGLQAVKVSKTSTPDMDGDAIGGTIDMRTPTAFDFKKPVARAFYTYGWNDRADSQGEPAATNSGQIDLGSRFGSDDQFGVFATGYYTKSHLVSEETENDGEWEPYRWRKNAEEAIDDKSMYLPGIDLDYRRIEQERIGGNISLDYQGDDTKLYLRGQYAQYKRVEDVNYLMIKSSRTKRLTQVNPEATNLTDPEKVITGVQANGDRIYGYTTAQIVDVNKDGIITDADRNASSYWSLNGRSGTWDPQNFKFSRSFEVKDQKQNLGTVNAGGETKADALTLTYDAAYSWGERETPDYYSVGFLSNANVAPFTQSGVLFSSADPRFPLYQIPAAAGSITGWDSLLLPDGASHSRDKTTNDRYSGKVDARYDMQASSWLHHLQAGVKFQRSTRDYDETKLFSGDLNVANMASSGLIERSLAGILHGTYEFGSLMGRDQVISAINKMGTQSFSADDQNGNDKHGRETIYAGYALADARFGDVQLITGVRVENTQVDNRFWVFDTNSHWGSSDASYTEVLPSATVNWRPTEDQVYRAAVWTSFSRPEYGYISGGQSIGRNSANEIVSISQGNPDLKPAESTNIDLSAEYYLSETSMVSAGLFYKDIKNFIFANGNEITADTTQGNITITQPQNGRKAQVYGMELNLVKDLAGVAAPFDGFTIYGNVTWQYSEAETGLAYRKGNKIPLINASRLMYNAGLGYQYEGLELLISYNYRSAYIEDLRDNAIDKWVQPNKSLDFHSRYSFENGMSIGFDAQNLTDEYRYYTTKGKNPSYQKDYMEPGRTFLVKASYAY